MSTRERIERASRWVRWARRRCAARPTVGNALVYYLVLGVVDLRGSP